MKIDIDQLTEAELIDLNHRIVERLRFLDQMRAHVEMLEFKIGDRVSFQPPGQGQLEGMLTRYNRKTVSVITDTGQRWNVSPTVLCRVNSAKDTNTAGSNGHRQVNATVTGPEHNRGMKPARHPRYVRHRFPAEVISHAVWLYFRFPLSLRMVEEMLAARGILVSHETVRQWALKFGQGFTNQIRRRLPAAGDKWHLDEVVISVAGRKHWLWRAVDQHGIVLDILVQSRRNAKAAERLLRKLLKKQGIAPRVMITDKLASYGAAKREIMPGVEHRQHRGLNNRAENSHQPTRRRERIMKRFKSAGQAQRFLSVHDQVANLFRCSANSNAAECRKARSQAFTAWAEVTGVAVSF